MRHLSRDTKIALGVTSVAVAAMAVDHLVGTEEEPGDEPGLADPGAFLLSVAVSIALVALVFGVVIRRARDDPDEAANKALLCSVLAIPALAFLFVGLPFPLAGGGVALGLHGREGRHRRRATAAVVLGALVLVVASAAYVVALVA